MIAAPAALTGHDPFGVAYEALRRRVLGANALHHVSTCRKR